MPETTSFSNDFLDAVLRLKCPPKDKELLFAIVRLMYGDGKTPRAVSLKFIAKYLRQDKSNIAKRLNHLIDCKVIRETRRPGYKAARQLVINYHYNEWKAVKYSELKTKKHLSGPAFWEDKKAASEVKSEIKSEPTTKSCSQNPESTTVAESTSLMEFRGRLFKESFGMEPIFEKSYGLRKLLISERPPEKDVKFHVPNKEFPKAP